MPPLLQRRKRVRGALATAWSKTHPAVPATDLLCGLYCRRRGGPDEAAGVRQARVNLTLKRANIEADPDIEAQDLADYLTGIGFEAFELDPGQLRSTATDKKGKDLLMRLGVAGFAMMNVMLLSVAVWSGATDATRDLFHWISAAIAIPTVGFSSQVFFRSAWTALRVGRLNMDVPISLAIILALGMSLYETMNHALTLISMPLCR